MEKRTRILLAVVLIGVVLSIVQTYWRTIILKDFYIVSAEEADIENPQ